jgi:hypothetical protein
MSSRSVRILAAAGAALALAAPATALAANNPLTGLGTSTTSTQSAPAITETVTTATPTSSSTSGGGLSTLDVVLIGVAAIAVFGGIAYAIRSDARSHTPRGTAMLDIDRERGTVTPRADRIRRSRAKAKAARRARRRSGR